MENYLHDRKTIVITNSPVSFTLMIADDWHRRVLIRSNDQNLDLVGLDNGAFSSEESLSFKKQAIFSKYLNLTERSFIVRTSSKVQGPVVDVDGRRSHLSFAWRGLANEVDLERIQTILQDSALDIASSLYEHENAEWQIATLVAACKNSTELYIHRVKTKRAMILIFVSFYILTLLAAYIHYKQLI